MLEWSKTTRSHTHPSAPNALSCPAILWWTSRAGSSSKLSPHRIVLMFGASACSSSIKGDTIYVTIHEKTSAYMAHLSCEQLTAYIAYRVPCMKYTRLRIDSAIWTIECNRSTVFSAERGLNKMRCFIKQIRIIQKKCEITTPFQTCSVIRSLALFQN